MYCPHCNGKDEEHSLFCPDRGKTEKEPYKECPCGINAQDCDYHRPVQKYFEFGTYDIIAPCANCDRVGALRRDIPLCLGGCRFDS